MSDENYRKLSKIVFFEWANTEASKAGNSGKLIALGLRCSQLLNVPGRAGRRGARELIEHEITGESVLTCIHPRNSR